MREKPMTYYIGTVSSWLHEHYNKCVWFSYIRSPREETPHAGHSSIFFRDCALAWDDMEEFIRKRCRAIARNQHYLASLRTDDWLEKRVWMLLEWWKSDASSSQQLKELYRQCTDDVRAGQPRRGHPTGGVIRRGQYRNGWYTMDAEHFWPTVDLRLPKDRDDGPAVDGPAEDIIEARLQKFQRRLQAREKTRRKNEHIFAERRATVRRKNGDAYTERRATTVRRKNEHMFREDFQIL